MNANADPAVGAAFGIVGIIFFALLGLAGLVIYFMPSIVAYNRSHPNFTAILVLNIFAGWTFVGFVVAIVWAFMAIERPLPKRRSSRFDDDDGTPARSVEKKIIDPDRNPFDFN